MSQPIHAYASRIVWEGNLGQGTSGYDRYSRTHRVIVDGKPDLLGSADQSFRGERDKHNPEELFLASIAACHMLFYLSLCARQQIAVVAYEDEVTGTLQREPNGGGKFLDITLHPKVTIARAPDRDRARALHATAHRLCFIANSCATPIRHVAIITVEQQERGT
jgi:organic hydroperoxide reductase OsmC/OhrA